MLQDSLLELKTYIETHKIKKSDHWYAVLKVKFDQPEEIFMKMKLLEELLNPESDYNVSEIFFKNRGINFLIDIIVQSCTILINDAKVEKFPLCAALISRTLKLFSKIVNGKSLENILDSETSLILIKSGLDFLNYMSDIGNNDKALCALMQDQFKHDKIIMEIFEMFTTVILYDNSRFKTIIKDQAKIKGMIFYFLIDSNLEYEKRQICESLIKLTEKCNEIGKDNFSYKKMPGDFFIDVMHKDYLPIVLTKIYNDANSSKYKSKKLEEVENLKIMKCNYFFNLFGRLLEQNGSLSHDVAGQILEPLLQEFKSMQRIEVTHEIEDSRLAHMINLISIVFKMSPEIKDTYADKEMFDFVLKDCLFKRRKDKSQPNFPICKTDETREKCFYLLLELMNNKDNKYFSKFARIVTKWMQRAKWRTAKEKDWDLKLFENKVSKKRKYNTTSDFIGLENMGCTCYMNSVIQQLFMIVPFRQAIQSVKNQVANDDKGNDTLYHTKLLFASLLNTGSLYHNPEHFFKTIKDVDGSDLNPLEQRDADEFLARFFEIIEPQIKGTSEEKKIQNIFYGSFANQMICIDCPHKSEKIEDFTTISLQVKNKHTLEEALDSYIESEILQGDNAYFCDKCEKKVSCKRRTCIKKLPNIMVIALKRFEIDFETMQHNKINEKVEFPFEVKMNKYLDKQLSKEDLLKEMEEMNWSYEDLPEDKKRVHDFEYPEDYYTYSLRGVVVHLGEANSGHYYSYIKDTKTGQWYEFNDTNVTPFDPNEMADKAFGGEYGEDGKRYSRFRSTGLKQFNAYMLLYERNYYIQTEKFMEKAEIPGENLEGFFNMRFSRLENNVEVLEEANDEDVDDVVSTHNEMLWESKQLFSFSFAKICYKISQDYKFDREGKDVLEQVRSSNLHDFDHLPRYGKHKWVSTFHRQALTILYFHTVLIRSNVKEYLKEYCDTIRNALANYYPIAFFYIENFCKTDIITEFITYRKQTVLRMQIPYFIRLACKKVYDEEEDMIIEYCDLVEEYGENLETLMKHTSGSSKTEYFYEDIDIKDHKGKLKTSKEMTTYLHDNFHKVPLLVVFANKLMKMARDFYEDIELTNKYHSLVNFFELFYNVADSGPEMKRYMVQNSFIGRLLDIYCHKNSDNRHFTRDLSHLPTYEIFCNDREEEISVTPQEVSPEGISIENDEDAEFDYALRLQKRKDARDYLTVEKEKKGKGQQEYDDDDYSSSSMIKGSKEPDDKRFGFLLRALSSLICSCRFKLSGRYIADDSLFLNTPNPNDLPEKEDRTIQLLCSDTIINQILILSSPNISTREAISNMYAHLCWENEEASNNILQIIVAELCNQECTFIDVIKQTPLVVNIAKINDSLSPSRMTYLIQNLYEKTFVDEYRTYIKYSDSILNLVLLIIRRNYDACKYMREIEDVMGHIEKFNSKNPIPRSYSRSQSLFRKISNDRVDKKLSEDDKNLLRSYAEHRLQLFHDLLVDIDFADHIETYIKKEGETFVENDVIYQKDDSVDYYKDEFKYWIEAKIIEDYGAVLQVSYKTPRLVIENSRGVEERKNCVKINKDSVRPEGVYTDEMLTQINCMYEYLYQKEIELEKSSYRGGYYSRY